MDSTATPKPPTGTVDITNLVATMKDTWIRWATTLVTTAASSTVYTAWLKWPVISTIFSTLVELVVRTISNAAEMEAFFLNTAIRKASQATDYVNAVTALKSLPPTVSDKDYEAYEQKEMVAFRNFVMVTN